MISRLPGHLAVSLAAILAACAFTGAGCADTSGGPSTPYDWQLPKGFPTPWVPEDNPMNPAKVELGRHLFYDKRLSVNGTMACASCHKQELAFSDGLAAPTGATGNHLARNAMTLTNAAYVYPYTWQNPVLETLEEQALVPMFAEAPVELGLTPGLTELLEQFRGDPVYGELFPKAFPGREDSFGANAVVSALAAFERTLISGQSPYDRLSYAGDEQALSPSARLGLKLFLSERCECYHCHTGLGFTSAFRSEGSRFLSKDYENNGLYNLGLDGAYPPESPGVSAMTANPSDNGKFRVPTLRNVAVTGPYMHDGSVATLEEVIEQYAAGGRDITDGVWKGDGRANPHKSPLVRGFRLSPEEKTALSDFLRSLTDEVFLTDGRLSNPWPPLHL